MASSGTIGKINAGGNDYLVASTAFAVCNTQGDVAAKVATIQDGANFTLINGITVHIYFNVGNTASSPTLNINNTGAVPIKHKPTDLEYPGNQIYWDSGTVVTATYISDYDISSGNSYWFIDSSTKAGVYPVVISLTSLTTGTANHTAYEILTAANSELLPVVFIPSFNLAMTYIISFSASGNLSDLVAYFQFDCHIGIPYLGAKAQGGNAHALLGIDMSNGVTITWTDQWINAATLDGNSIVSNTLTGGSIALTTGTSSGTLAAGDHGHGNITNGGDITTNVAIASGDRLVINDESESKINNSSITFGTSTTQFLANNGTWQTPAGGGVDSTDTSNKIFLIGAETQGTDVSTYSDNQVYATNGQLDANKLRVAETATIQYNSSDGAIEFVFA